MGISLRKPFTILAACLFVFSGFILLAQQSPAQPQKTARVFAIDGAIGPATSDYLQRGLAAAEAQGISLAIITMDTPGGLDTAMRDIIQAILDSDIPVVTYVWPQGARAASAGTYILYASHVAAMAPATNLGSATPVQIGMPSLPTQPADEDTAEDNASAPATGSTAMERKIINDAIAYIRGLAELHGRNAEWAVTAVTDAANLPASEALAMNVIDIVAQDVSDLVRQLDGRQVMVGGETVVLATTGMMLEQDTPDWRTEFLKVITNPNLILILGMLGAYGLIIEFYNPGFGFAGITGAICLFLAAYGLQLLPINYAGLGLIFFGIILILSEAFIPSFGILGIGGIISFLIGAIILVDTDIGVFRVSFPLLAGVTTAAAMLMIYTMRIFLRVQQQPVVSGVDTMIGHTGEAVDSFDSVGMVKINGELWRAVSGSPLQVGDRVRVEKVNDLELVVSKL